MDKTELSARIDADMPQFRSLPFWSWNDELETDELCFQIRRMKEAGIGGYFMHARGGLTTPYMGEKWMDAVAACLKEGENEGMESWAYDENGWPSGFADGEVPKMGEAYQQKGLDFAVLDESLTLPKRTLGVYRLCGGSACRVDTPAAGDTAVFVTINRYYIDALNADAVTAFLRCTHERYYARFREDFGTRLKGFFTDEPQYANGLIPWSPVLDKAFFAEWGYDPKDKLGAFYLPADEDRAFRWQYYRTASRLFCDGFIRQMGDWCRDHGVRLTGHLMAEDSLLSQLRSTGGVMSGYEYFDMPGIDWLGRGIASPVVPRQLGSAAAQLGKRQTLSESFALCGWDVSFNELRHIAQWQFVNGVNRLCSHLSAYSLRGLRKRDYPPSLHTQLPWFSADAVLQDYFARTGAALAQGQEDVDVLLLSPLGVAAGHHNRADERELRAISDRFDRAAAELAGQHLLHHYGDETLLRRHGRVEGGCLIVGQMRYRTVILPYMDSIAPETAALLTAFIRSGGRVLALGAAPLLCGYAPDAAWAAIAAALPVLPDAAAAAAALADGCTPHILNADGGEEPQVHVMRRRLKDGQNAALSRVAVSGDARHAHAVPCGRTGLCRGIADRRRGTGAVPPLRRRKHRVFPLVCPGGKSSADLLRSVAAGGTGAADRAARVCAPLAGGGAHAEPADHGHRRLSDRRRRVAAGKGGHPHSAGAACPEMPLPDRPAVHIYRAGQGGHPAAGAAAGAAAAVYADVKRRAAALCGQRLGDRPRLPPVCDRRCRAGGRKRADPLGRIFPASGSV